jgi:non-canonical purine NTP pyrophosphatase (RdgB/HAM1 family)
VTFRLGLTGGLASGKTTVARLLAERGCTVVDADHLVAELYRPGEPGARVVEELFGGEFLQSDGSVDRKKLASRVFADDLARKRLETAIWPLVRRRFEALAERLEANGEKIDEGGEGAGGADGADRAEAAEGAGAGAAEADRGARPVGGEPAGPSSPFAEGFEARAATSSRAAAPAGGAPAGPASAPAEGSPADHRSSTDVVVLEATLLVEAGFAPAFDLVVTVEASTEARLARAVARGLTAEEARARLVAQGGGEARRGGADLVLDNSGSLTDLEAEVDGLLDEIRAGKFGGRGRHAEPAGGGVPGLPDFLLVTGNRHKLAEAERALGRAVEAAPLDLPEIQSLDLVEVLRAKAAEAWRRLGRPLVVEESGLELDALGGFPGPLIKWMLEAVGAEGLARTAHALGEPRVTAHCALLYKHGPGDGDEVVAHGRVGGELVLPPRGAGGFGWDPVIVPDGAGGRTLAELAADEAGKEAFSSRGHAWRELTRLLAEPTP